MLKYRSILLFVVFTALIAISRMIPHQPNLTIVIAAALWSFAFLRDSRLAWLAPVLGMFIGDLYVGFHGTHFYLYTYGALILIAELGRRFSPVGSSGTSVAGPHASSVTEKAIRFGTVTVSGSALFFVITNLGVFFVDRLYPMTSAGFIECFVMAIPFWTSQLVVDVVCSAGFLLAYHMLGFAAQIASEHSEC